MSRKLLAAAVALPLGLGACSLGGLGGVDVPDVITKHERCPAVVPRVECPALPPVGPDLESLEVAWIRTRDEVHPACSRALQTLLDLLADCEPSPVN